MKLPMVVSPATWDLIERLRPDLDVAIDVFDTTLVPLLPESEQEWCSRLREVADSREPEGGRERLLASIRTGRHLLFSDRGLRIGLFPIRYHREVAGVLAAAAAERRTIAFPGQEHAETTSRSVQEALDRRIERIGWSLRAALEADIALWEKLDQAEHRARWADTTLHFLDYLCTRTSEAELFTAAMQAAAVWGDIDAHVYRRTLGNRYVLDTTLPFRDENAPPGFDTALVDGRTLPVRLTSIAELEQVGWRGASGEVSLLPIGPPDHPSLWVLALAGATDERLTEVFAVVARTLSMRAEQLLAERVSDIGRRLHARVTGPHAGVPATAALLLNELAVSLSAAQVRLLSNDPSTDTLRLLASVGGTLFGSEGPRVSRSPGESSAECLQFPLEVGAASPALLQVIAPIGTPFSSVDAAVAERVSRYVETWLAGAWCGLTTAGAAPFGDRKQFERRLDEELERARRHQHPAGLLVVASPANSPGADPMSSPVADAVRSQLRTTDILGYLSDGRLAAFLVHTPPAAVEVVANRVEQRLRALAGPGWDSEPALGRAAFPSAGETAAALLAAAEDDILRRQPGDTLLSKFRG